MIGYNYMYKTCVKSCQNNYNESVVQFKYNVIGHTGIIAVRINNWSLSLLPKYVLTIGASLYYPLVISPQFRSLEMIAWPSAFFVQPHSLVVGKWGPKHVGDL